MQDILWVEEASTGEEGSGPTFVSKPAPRDGSENGDANDDSEVATKAFKKNMGGDETQSY